MDKVEQRAWELLEAECGKPLPFDVPTHAALSAIRAALAHQPAADPLVEWGNRPLNFTATVGTFNDGVQPSAVNEGSRIVTNQLLHWGGIPVHVTGTVTTSPGNWPLIDAALTEARNVR